MDIRESSDLSIKAERHFWELARISFASRMVKRFFPQVRKVLDVGCGDGIVVEKLAEQFAEADFYAVDTALSAENAALLKKRSAYSDRISFSGELPSVSDGSYDVILLLDVLEHVPDEREFLCKICEYLHPDGIIVTTVPAFQSLFTDHDRYLKHFRRYNRRELCRSLSASALDIAASGYMFFSLLPFRLLQKLMRMSAKKDQALRVGNPVLNRIAAAVLDLDARITFFSGITPVCLPGLSCAAVAKKSRRL